MNRITLTSIWLVLASGLASYGSNPLDEWQWRNPLPNGNSFDTLTYANGTFVAAGEGVGTSVDGTNWVNWLLPPNGYGYFFGGIAWGNDTWVMVGFTGSEEGTGSIVMTSPDLVTWTPQTAPQGVASLSGIAYANGQFVAAGWGENGSGPNFGAIITSPDGINWTLQNSGTTDSFLNNVVYGNGLFVVDSSQRPTILTSPDGTNWTVGQVAVDRLLGWASWGLAYANGMFVDVSGAGIVASDGSTWTNRVSSTGAEAITYGEGHFLAVSLAGQVQTSPDGLKWTLSGTMGISSIKALTYGNGMFVGVNPFSVVSMDGIHWSNLASAVTTQPLEGVTYGQGTFVAVGESGTILHSADGVRWNVAANPTTNNELLTAVTYGSGNFVAVGTSGDILTSTDANDWGIVTNTGGYLDAVAYGGGQFVAVGAGQDITGAILTSTNSITWANQDSGVMATLQGIAYGNGLYVAGVGEGLSGGTGAWVVTSPDGMVWTEQSCGATNEIQGMAYGNGIFVAVGDNGFISTSPDGTNWTEQFNGQTNADLVNVSYGNGTFVATGSPGALLTSTDGTNWVSRNSGTLNQLLGSAFGQNTVIVVGDLGTILQSGVMPPSGAQLSAVPGWANGLFGFSLSAPLRGQWEIQTSTNLQNWTDLTMIKVTNATMPLIDNGAMNSSQRFYRAVSR